MRLSASTSNGKSKENLRPLTNNSLSHSLPQSFSSVRTRVWKFHLPAHRGACQRCSSVHAQQQSTSAIPVLHTASLHPTQQALSAHQSAAWNRAPCLPHSVQVPFLYRKHFHNNIYYLIHWGKLKMYLDKAPSFICLSDCFLQETRF